MLTVFEFINVEELHKKNSVLLSFYLFSASSDLVLNRIGINCINHVFFLRQPVKRKLMQFL